MKKALHIDSSHLEWIKQDAASILVKCFHQSPLRFPFCRVSRITLSGHWEHGLDVFCECAMHQIPVFFFDGRGNIRCQLMPHQREPLPLAEYLEELTYCETMQHVLRDWMDTQKRVVLHAAGAHSGDPTNRCQVLHKQVYAFLAKTDRTQPFLILFDWYVGFFQADVAQHLLPFGVDPCRPEVTHFIQQLTDMFQPLLEIKCANALIAFNSPPTLSNAASSYHRHAEEVGFLLDRMLNQLLWQFEASA